MKEGLQLDRLILIVCVPIYPNDTDREDVDWLILILRFIQMIVCDIIKHGNRKSTPNISKWCFHGKIWEIPLTNWHFPSHI